MQRQHHIATYCAHCVMFRIALIGDSDAVSLAPTDISKIQNVNSVRLISLLKAEVADFLCKEQSCIPG